MSRAAGAHNGGMKRLIALVLLLLCLPGVARAENASDVAAGLRNAAVYESPGIDLIDQDALSGTLSDNSPQLFVAALPADAATTALKADQLAESIGKALGNASAVILVITVGGRIGAEEGRAARSQGFDADRALADQLKQPRGAFTKGTVTQFVKDFKARLDGQERSGGSSSSGAQSSSDEGGGSGTKILIVLLVLGGGGYGLYALSRKKKAAKQAEGLRADVEQLYHRLGSEVSLLNAGNNEIARQAMADASERYNTCGATLANADSPAEFAAARRTAVEGLTAARVARKEMGLDPGPEIPLPPGSGPKLVEEQQLQLGDQTVYGSPDYAPGRQHYYEGGNVNGQMVRGGWYSAPFWEPFLLGSLLAGGFGGGGLFGGGGGGYERGFEQGRESAEQDSGGDWGGASGGGDWGGGGDGGGGDWGGGGDGGGGGDW